MAQGGGGITLALSRSLARVDPREARRLARRRLRGPPRHPLKRRALGRYGPRRALAPLLPPARQGPSAAAWGRCGANEETRRRTATRRLVETAAGDLGSERAGYASPAAGSDQTETKRTGADPRVRALVRSA
jgi:hypothetical protein